MKHVTTAPCDDLQSSLFNPVQSLTHVTASLSDCSSNGFISSLKLLLLEYFGVFLYFVATGIKSNSQSPVSSFHAPALKTQLRL